MKGIEDVESDIMSMINDRQEVTYNELKDYVTELDAENDTLDRALAELEKAGAIASRSSGGIPTYYMLQEQQPIKRVFIVEDDPAINKLMALSIGSNYETTQIYDGKEAIEKIKYQKPDLVILDLMLPGADGLEVCKTIKTTPVLKDITVIIVSAMDATSNRFKGIKYGADYYIKKPFDPRELGGLVTIFLKKKGKKFDPLIDLPNEERISGTMEKAVKSTGADYSIGRLRVDNLANFAQRFGNDAGITILRLVSQLLQDKVRDTRGETFVGFLNGDDFVLAGNGKLVEKTVDEIKQEFQAVLPFVYQSEGYKPIELGIEDTYTAQSPMLSLTYAEIKRETLIARRAEVLKEKRANGDIGSYTYDELRRMLGSEDLDITITRDSNRIKLSIGRGAGRQD